MDMMYKKSVKYGIFLRLVCYNPYNNGKIYYFCAIEINPNIFNIVFHYFYFKSWDVFSLAFWWAEDFTLKCGQLMCCVHEIAEW